MVTAVKELKDALAHAPNLEIAHLDLARIYYHCGWADESRREIEEARKLNPFGEPRRVDAAMTVWLENPREGLKKFQRLPLEMRQSWVSRWQILWTRATFEDPATILPEAEAMTRSAPASDPVASAILAVVRARAGQPTDDLELRIARDDRRVGHFHHVLHFLADVHAIRKDAVGAAELLEEAVESGFPCAPAFDNDPLLAGIRGAAEYATVKEKIEQRNAAYRAALKGVI